MLWFYVVIAGTFAAVAILDGGSLGTVLPAALAVGAAVYELIRPAGR